MRRVLAIANPVSGRGRAKKQLPKFVDAAQSADVEMLVRYTDSAGHATEIAREGVGRGVDGVVSVGGDGTLNEVVNGIGESHVPVLVVPQGTGNVLAKEIAAKASASYIHKALARWNVRRRDLGKMADGRLFTCFVGAGFDAECCRLIMENRSGGMRMLQYLPAMVRAVANSRFKTIKVSVDDEVCEGASYALVSITPAYGGPIELTSDAVADDGLFDVLSTHSDLSVTNVTRLVGRAALRNLKRAKDTRISRGTTVEISADEKVPIQVDGDFAGYLPVRVEMLAGALRLLNP